jgi:hypothetical protein
MFIIISIIIAVVLIGVVVYFVMSSSVQKRPQVFPSIGTYAGANAICKSKGLELCSLKDICPDGPLKNPIMGMTNSDEWIPVKDKVNDYVSVGNFNPNVRLCRTHGDALKSLPGWATNPSNFNFRKRVACC